MAINVYNNAEGGIHNLAVTTGNSGGASGTAINNVATNGGTLTFTNQISNSGTYSYNVSATSGAICRMNFSAIGASACSRAYIYLTGYPSVSTQLCQFYASSNNVSLFGVTGAGKTLVQDAAGTNVSNGVATVPLNTWLRIEMAAAIGTTSTNGYTSINMYAGDDIYSPLFSYTNSAANTGTANITIYGVGKVSATGSWSTMYVDDITIQDSINSLGPQAAAALPWTV